MPVQVGYIADTITYKARQDEKRVKSSLPTAPPPFGNLKWHLMLILSLAYKNSPILFEVTNLLSSHTDNWLVILCTLIKVLACKESDVHCRLMHRCNCLFLLTLGLLVVCRCEWHRNLLLYQCEKERQPARTVTRGLQLTSLLVDINIFQEETISMYCSFVMTGVLKKYFSGFSSQNSHQLISQNQIIIISVEEGNSTIYYCQGTASQEMLHH